MPRPFPLTRALAAVGCMALLGSLAGCEARVYGAPPMGPTGSGVHALLPHGAIELGARAS